jgi:tellurite resistance protein TehA-like permease
MGTGIVAILLHIIPFGHTYLHYASIVFFILNIVLFAVVLSMSILRYTLYPEIWAVMIQDPTNSLFLATCPMGFATLIEMWVFVCVPAWGDWTRTVAWVLWIVGGGCVGDGVIVVHSVFPATDHLTEKG